MWNIRDIFSRSQSRKPAARLGEVPFANKVSYRGSGRSGPGQHKITKLGAEGGVPIGTFLRAMCQVAIG